MRLRRWQRLTGTADLVRAGIVGMGATLVAVGNVSAGLRAFLVLPAAFLGRLVRIHPAYDLLFGLALATEAVGAALAGYRTIGWDDTLSHLALPLLCGPILFAGLVRLEAIAPPSSAASPRFLAGAALVTAAAVLSLGAVWELVEWAADAAFGTDYSQGYEDTLVDLLADSVAAVAGGALVAGWLRASAGSSLAMLEERGE